MKGSWEGEDTVDIPVGPLAEALEVLTSARAALDRTAATLAREEFGSVHELSQQSRTLITSLGQIIEKNTWTDRFLNYSAMRGLMILLELNNSRELIDWLLKERGEQWVTDERGGLRNTQPAT